MTNTNTGWDAKNRDKRLRDFENRFLQDMKRMKKEEKQAKELTNGRKRWFNQKTQETQKNIATL